jgi:hypothetical protein
MSLYIAGTLIYPDIGGVVATSSSGVCTVMNCNISKDQNPQHQHCGKPKVCSLLNFSYLLPIFG